MYFNKNLDNNRLYFEDLKQFDMLTEKEEKELFIKYAEAKGKEKKCIKNKLIESNLRLVVAIAKKFTGRGQDFIDLISFGNLGLMRAIDKYDVNSGNRFSTCAFMWIRQAIQAGIRDYAREIRLPGHVYEDIQKIRQCENEAMEKENKVLSHEEVAERLNMPLKKVKRYRQDMKAILSLDAEIKGGKDDEDSCTLFKYISSNDFQDVETEYMNKAQKDIILNLVNTLPDRERTVILMRYGFVRDQVKTFQEIADVIGVSYVRAKQIERRAIERLRKSKEFAEIKEIL